MKKKKPLQDVLDNISEYTDEEIDNLSRTALPKMDQGPAERIK